MIATPAVNSTTRHSPRSPQRCVAPVNTVAEAVDDEQYVSRGLVAEAVHVSEGPFRQSAPVWAGTVAPDGPYEIRDGATTDTAELLAAVGFDPAEIESLLADGAVA